MEKSEIFLAFAKKLQHYYETFYSLKNLLEMGMLLKLNHGETIRGRN